MTAMWMLATGLAAVFLAIAASCAEHVLRRVDRPARGAWTAAIAASVAWPAVLALLASGRAPRGAVMLPAIEVSRLVPASLGATGGSLPSSPDRWLLGAWALASLFLFVRLVAGLARAHRLCAAAERREVGGVELLLVDDAMGPAVLGVLRPRIVFPRTLLALDAPLRDVVLRHEQEHVDARDARVAFFCALAVIAMPWNAALWYMAQRARLALEIDCDRRVLRGGISPSRYGKLLLLVAQSAGVRALGPALVSSPSHLERRLSAMMTKRSSSHHRLRIAFSLAGVVLAAAAACATRASGGAGPTDGIRTLPMLTVVPSARAAGDTGTAPHEGNVFFEFQVDKQVQQVPGSLHVTYPAELKSQGVQGEVLAQFVVDETGAVDPHSIKVLKSSHEQFTAAVVEAIPHLRFTPAEVRGRKVKQLVQQPFTFAMSK